MQETMDTVARAYEARDMCREQWMRARRFDAVFCAMQDEDQPTVAEAYASLRSAERALADTLALRTGGAA